MFSRQKYVTPLELYEAALNACRTLYVANGGNSRDTWIVRPYPETAAISCAEYNGIKRWTLCMPAFNPNELLPRWKAELIAAYTVHELLHTLWTNFDTVKQSYVEGLHSLVNSLEDNRIEYRAIQGDLVNVSEAAPLLEMLNAYIWDRDSKKPGFSLDNPNSFAFILNIVIFHERHKYKSTFPNDWRQLVRQDMLPLFDLALAEFGTLQSTEDCLALARRLKAMAKALPPEKPQQPPQVDRPQPGRPCPEGEQGEDGRGRKGHQGEAPEGDEGEAPEGEAPEGDEGEAPEGDEGEAPEGEAPEGDEGEAPEGDEGGAPEGDEGEAPEGEGEGEAPEGEGEGRQGNGQQGTLGGAPPSSADLTDDAQEYDEASLNEMSTTRPEEMSHIEQALNAPSPRIDEFPGALPTGGVKAVANAIESPMRLRRHLTLAVKAPERVAFERHQISGRLDLRNVVGMATGAETVYRRRIEEDAKEAAVTLLLDMSSSMNTSGRSIAARAMALHMGDALRAAAVKFEVVAFTTSGGPLVTVPKSFKAPWNDETKKAVAQLRGCSGTAILPAVAFCAKRLLQQAHVTRRILLVLTDGDDGYSAEANRLNCLNWRRRGVETIGIGLMVDNMENCSQTFASHAIYVARPADLSEAGIKELVRVLDKGAARGA
jgi:uncharacterized protein with von Willebrand factor type A (vWA) domain